MVFSFEWKKNPSDWLGMVQNRDAANAGQMQGMLEAGGAGQQAQMLGAQNAAFGAEGGGQQAQMLAEQNAGLLSPEDSVQQVGSSMPNAPDTANVDLSADFDLAGLADSLASGAGGDDFKFNKPNMTPMTVGGGGQGYESMAAQPVQPLSTAMGAITSPQQQMYGAQQQPQDINMMRRMLGLV